VTFIYNTNQGHKNIAEYIQQQWKANLGIDVTLQNMEFKTFIDLRTKHDFVVARAGWIADYPDPSNFEEMWITGGGNNDAAYSKPAYDKLVDQAKTLSGDARIKVLQQIEKMFLADDQVMIPIYHYANQDLIDTGKWGGWYSNPLGYHPWKYLYKK
jgi:oligopeptide transport system substrate-binding protein